MLQQITLIDRLLSQSLNGRIMSLFRRVSRLGFGVSRKCSFPARAEVLREARLVSAASSVCVCWSPTSVCSYSTLPPTDLSIQYRYGRPVLSLPLPSRGEVCRFSIRPMLMTVGHFLDDIKKEDHGVTIASILDEGGQRVANTTYMDTVLNQDFQLIINNSSYNIHSPGRESHEHVTCLDDVKSVVHMLHSALNLPEHQLTTQTQLLLQLDLLKQQLGPMEKVRAQLGLEAESKSMRIAWAGLVYLSLQGGFLAYLTWYVFAWDVMEPVTYFLTYSASMGFFAYYILTKQDLLYPDAKDRQFLRYFHKKAKMERFNINKYNQLRDQLETVEGDLKRLRSPIQLQLPVDQIQPKS